MGTTCQVVFAGCSAFLPHFYLQFCFFFHNKVLEEDTLFFTIKHQRNCVLFSTDKVLLTLATNGPPGSDDSLGCINMIRLQGLSSLEKRGFGWEGAHGGLPVAVRR